MRFSILNTDEVNQLEGIDYPILLNTDHILSVKPIKIMHQGNLINGHWIRTVSGKKYKATRIPQSLHEQLKDTESLTNTIIDNETDRINPEDVIKSH